jgi:polyhydroxyalkanoate synthesis regulator phasin
MKMVCLGFATIPGTILPTREADLKELRLNTGTTQNHFKSPLLLGNSLFKHWLVLYTVAQVWTIFSIGLLVAVLSVVVSTLSLVINLTRSVGDLGERITRVERDIERLGEGLGKLTNVIGNVGEVIVEYLGLKGVLNQGEVNYLRSEIRRLASTTTNPFTEAEKKRLLELVDKDDLTLEEAEELHELARKFYREYFDKTPDAYKVLLYAAAKHGEVLRKHSASGKQPNQQST